MSKNFSSRADMLETIKTEALADSAALSQKLFFILSLKSIQENALHFLVSRLPMLSAIQ